MPSRTIARAAVAAALTFLGAVAAGACAPSTGGGTTCQTVPGLSCAGGAVEACTTTDDHGACARSTYKYGGQEPACNACGDCAQAAMELARTCGAAGAAEGGADAALPPWDAARPPAPDAAAPDAGAGVTTQCQAGPTCASGASYALCETSLASGACVGRSYAFVDGTMYACASCADCAGASLAAQAHCGTAPPPDAGSVCGLPPTLHPEAQPGVYCPFTPTGRTICAAGQACCIAPIASAQPSSCVAGGAACPVAGSLAWACEDALDCAGSAAGPVCCGSGAVVADATCGFHRGTGFTGSRCAASCGAGEVVICESATQCAAGKTCTPFKTSGLNLGACL